MTSVSEKEMAIGSDDDNPQNSLWRFGEALSRTGGSFLARVGPACLVSVAALDPGNLEVDVQAGTLLGYSLIWAILYSSIAGWLLQNISAQLAILTNLHLAELCAMEYSDSPFVCFFLFAIAELSILSFDVAEVIGTAFALQLLLKWPLWFGCIVSAVDTLAILYFQRHGLRKIEIAIESMLVMLAASLLYEFMLSQPAPTAIARGTFIPSVGDNPREGSMLAIGILGSLVMSHNLFLHSWLIKLRDKPSHDTSGTSRDSSPLPRDLRSACGFSTLETGIIFIGTFLVNCAVLATAAAKFYPHRAEDRFRDIGLMDASALLQNVLGTKYAYLAWAIALLCSGHAATLTGTLAAQTLVEGFFRIGGADSTVLVSFITRAVAIVPAVATAIYAGSAGSDQLIVASQVVLSFALPFAVIPMLRFINCARRRHQVDNQWLVVCGWIAFVFISVANVVATVTTIRNELKLPTLPAWVYAIVLPFAVLYLYVLAILLCRPLRLPALLSALEECDLESSPLLHDPSQR